MAASRAAAAAPARRPAPGRRPTPPPARRAPLRVVPPGRRLRPGPTIVLGGLLAFATAIAVVVFQAVLVQGQANLDELNLRIAEANDRQAELRLEVAELESPERIVEAARDLGMVPPPGVTYLTPAGLVTVPGAEAETLAPAGESDPP